MKYLDVSPAKRSSPSNGAAEKSFTFPSDLPNAASRWILVGTQDSPTPPDESRFHRAERVPVRARRLGCSSGPVIGSLARFDTARFRPTA
jgi:hypothetical protein